MKPNLKQLLPLLEYLNKCSKKEQQQFLATAKPHIIQVLTDICYNFYHKNITTHSKYIKKLKPYAKLITQLCKKRLSIKKRRHRLQTGGFIGRILSLIPLLAQLFIRKRRQ